MLYLLTVHYSLTIVLSNCWQWKWHRGSNLSILLIFEEKKENSCMKSLAIWLYLKKRRNKNHQCEKQKQATEFRKLSSSCVTKVKDFLKKPYKITHEDWLHCLPHATYVIPLTYFVDSPCVWTWQLSVEKTRHALLLKREESCKKRIFFSKLSWVE